MKNADIFELSSKQECFELVLVEAMAVNTYVISSNCKSGPPEILENGDCGDLFEIGDVDNLAKLKTILASGNLKQFIEIVESEALTLHAMMMTSMPYFILMKPNTLEIINKIWEYREKTNSKVCFTLDAGANVHVLYPQSEKQSVLEFIKNELVNYCQNGHYICDQIGLGANQI